MKLTIRKAFRQLIPPLSPEELAQLEANIVRDGCRDPLVVWGDVLIDGHNRLEICERLGIKYKTAALEFEDDDAASAWIIQNQFGRRNLAPYTRVELALKLEPLLREKAKKNNRLSAGRGKKGCQNSDKVFDTKKDLAKLAGLSHDTIAKGKLIHEHADEETKAKLRTNQVSIHRVAKDIKEKNQRTTRESKRTEAAKSAPASDERIIVGDFRKKADAVADGSLSLIFTDPPYDRKATSMLDGLGEFASAKLAEGGSLLCYVGQTQIPAAIAALSDHLRYWWVIACVHAGKATVMREYGINAGWKSVLWFVKATRDDNSVMVSDVMSGGQEKERHEWQQAESEAAYWIEKLCPKSGLVCDPFLGSGTTAAAAQSLGRKWIGFEVDSATAGAARGRVAK